MVYNRVVINMVYNRVVINVVYNRVVINVRICHLSPVNCHMVEIQTYNKNNRNGGR